MPHGALIEARLMADEIEAQIEEAANMGEPPSFALERHQADWLVWTLRRLNDWELLKVKAEAMQIVIAALAAKAELSDEKLIEQLRTVENELKAKRWLT